MVETFCVMYLYKYTIQASVEDYKTQITFSLNAYFNVPWMYWLCDCNSDSALGESMMFWVGGGGGRLSVAKIVQVFLQLSMTYLQSCKQVQASLGSNSMHSFKYPFSAF